MTANHMMKIIGEELRNGFFQAVSDNFKINSDELYDFFILYFEGQVKEQEVERKVKPRTKSPIKPKEKPKRKPSGKNELPRGEQTEIKFSDIANFTVANLMTYNRERGLITSGNKAALKEPLEKYEIDNGNGPSENEVEVEEKKTTVKAIPPSRNKKVNIERNQIYIDLDEYNRAIAYDDLVCEKDESGEYVVCGAKYEDGKVGKLTAEHIEKCKANNIKYNIDNFAS
jgi:hypothetical protein